MAISALQRKNMVESQVRPSDVTDRRITAAMQDIARESFLPAGIDPSLAYMDGAIPAGGGRVMTAPRTLARVLQLANIDAGDKVLIVGALTGYSAAIAARLAGSVVALESDEASAAAAGTNLAKLGATNVTVVRGALAGGAPQGAPYDVIVIDGGFEDLPEALVTQLAEGGRLVGIETGADVGRAVAVTKVGSVMSQRVAFDAAAALLPGFAKPKGFVF